MKSPPRRLHGLRVLVVEDHVDLGELPGQVLSVEGADATTAQTGRTGLDLSHTRRFDVVLSDLGVPDIPGEIDVRRAMAAGAKVVFRKPIEWERLVGGIRTAHIRTRTPNEPRNVMGADRITRVRVVESPQAIRKREASR